MNYIKILFYRAIGSVKDYIEGFFYVVGYIIKGLIENLSYLANRFILGKEYLIADSKYGLKFKIKIVDDIGRTIYERGDYSTSNIDFILNGIKYNNEDIFIDVGANIGWHSLTLERYRKELKNIYAFEPDPLNYSLLTENMRLNNSSRIIAINKALSDAKGKVTLYKDEDKNPEKHSILPIFNDGSETVDAITLDEFIKEYNINKKIKLLKIDVEGYEYQVLLGAKSALKYTENLIIKISPYLLLQSYIEPGLVIELLYDEGFKPFFFYDGTKLEAAKKEFLLENRYVLTTLWKKSSN